MSAHDHRNACSRSRNRRSGSPGITAHDGPEYALESYDYISLRGPAGILHDIVVDPGHRGRGVGRLLLGATLAHLKSRGAPRVVLSTADQNVAAHI